MKSVMKKTFLALCTFFSFTSTIVAQTDSVFVEKKECVSENSYKGFKLIIHFYSNSSIQIAKPYDYYLDFLKDIDSKTKLELIRLLLQFQDDSSLCFLKTYNYSFNGIEGCSGKPEGVNRYTIQLDALFIINRLCWPKLMELYSCSPVLYDTKLQREINSDPDKIRYVFGEYKKWYEECKALGRIPKYFPFNEGRYVWYGGKKSVVAKE